MKKLLFFIIFTFASGFLYSQSLDFKTYYEYKDGCEGAAAAEYINSEKVDDAFIKTFVEAISKNGNCRELLKLSKNTLKLCEAAISEWDVKDGENYFVICAANKWAKEGIFLLVTIKDNGKSFDWRAWSVTEK